jgi:hypothetical protein
LTVYPGLLGDFQKYTGILEASNGSDVVDLRGISWFYPTTLLPVCLYLMNNGPRVKYYPPLDQNASMYLDTVLSGKAIDSTRSYVPIILLPKQQSEFDKIFDCICNLGGNFSGEQEFRVIISELTDNIYQHSRFNNAIVMAQRYAKKGFMDLCIIDDGVTIPGSLSSARMLYEDDTSALIDAVEGASSKNDPGRGHGLGESIIDLTQKYGGSVLVISRRGVLHFNKLHSNRYILKPHFQFGGTLISTRVPQMV